MRIKNLFKKYIQQANKILITTHDYPDADGIGSEVALCLALKELGKDVVCVNEDALLERYKYLDSQDLVLSYKKFIQKNKNKEIDLFIVVDTNSANRIGRNMIKLFERSKNILYIDHHPCHKAIEAIHCIDTTRAATGQLIGELIQSLGIKFTQDMALPLYTSILIDTSSFRYPNVNGDTHRALAKFLDTGIKPHEAYNHIYGTKKISHMQLLGSVLSTAQTTSNGEIAWITVSQKNIDAHQSDAEDTHAFINHLLVLDNIKIACMFRDIGDQIKISFRSAGEIDVGIIATALGGGGHNHSSATIIEGELKEVVPNTVKKIQLILKLLKNEQA